MFYVSIEFWQVLPEKENLYSSKSEKLWLSIKQILLLPYLPELLFTDVQC